MEQYALYAGAGMSLPGLVFMLNCRKLWTSIFEQDFFRKAVGSGDSLVKSEAFVHWAAMLSHMAFILGALAFALGTTALGLALALPPALALLAGLSGIMGQLFYMVVNAHSPMGLPGISGPPVPARVVLVVIELALIANAVSGFASGLYAGVDTKTLAGLCAYSLALPWLIAAKHRAKGWRHQPIVPAFGVKTD